MTMDYNDTHRISFKLPDRKLEALDDVVDDDESRSAVLREAVDMILAERGDDVDDDEGEPMPEPEHLADAYRTLVDTCRRRGSARVPLEVAKSKLWNQRTPKSVVRSELLHPLKTRGWVDVRAVVNTVYVYPRALAAITSTTEATA